MTADEWLSQIRDAVQTHFPTKVLQAEIVRGTRVKARLQVSKDCFLDLFFREETGRADYTLIVGEARMFGIDNLGGWHEHSVRDPASHEPCPEPTPGEAVRRLKEASDILADSTAV